MPEESRMRTMHNLKIQVLVEDMINVLSSNRNKHAQEYLEAKRRYLAACKVALSDRLQALGEGQFDEDPENTLAFKLRRDAPEDFTEVYDQVLEMLEFTSAQTIETIRCRQRDRRRRLRASAVREPAGGPR